MAAKLYDCRCEFAAGQDYLTDPMADVFHNDTLKNMLYTAWKHVAAHYATWDYIAAYEVMAEPRDKNASPQLVRETQRKSATAQPHNPLVHPSTQPQMAMLLIGWQGPYFRPAARGSVMVFILAALSPSRLRLRCPILLGRCAAPHRGFSPLDKDPRLLRGAATLTLRLPILHAVLIGMPPPSAPYACQFCSVL